MKKTLTFYFAKQSLNDFFTKIFLNQLSFNGNISCKITKIRRKEAILKDILLHRWKPTDIYSRYTYGKNEHLQMLNKLTKNIDEIYES